MIDRRNFIAGTTAASLFTLSDIVLGRLTADNVLAATPEATGPFEAQDWADGTVMWTGTYSDMPYLVALPTGELLSTLTVNSAPEGSDVQHTIVLSSVDLGETWRTITAMEPAAAPESSWGMPWLHPSGRLYVFYTYNVNNVRDIAGSNRCDSVGVISYKSSVDGGRTWGSRQDLTWPPSTIDLRNPWAGVHRLLWLSGHVVHADGGVGYFGLSKMGAVGAEGIFSDTEAFVVKVVETAPGVLTSSISAAIRTADVINEEPSPVVFPDGVINVAFRTTTGRLGEAWSADDGASWSIDWSRDAAWHIVHQPRAKAAQFLLPDGRILLWGHNSAAGPSPTVPRNPVFYRIGQRDGNRIIWGAPRLLLWDKNPATRMSYPSAIVVGAELYVAATDKKTAKLFRFPLAGL